MFAHDRYEIILELLRKNKSVKVIELIERFDVSIETVRRDLEYLEKQDLLKRVYGGATLNKKTGIEVDYNLRETRNLEEKIEIGRQAAELIQDGDTIILDLGTTTLEVARNLNGKENLTVLTNSLKIALELNSFPGIRTFLMGGLIRREELAVSGFLAKYCLKQFNVDKALISVGGITIENGITDYHVEEAEIRMMMIEAAEQVIALCDYSKFGTKALINVCELDKVGTLVVDSKVPKSIIKSYESLGLNVVAAKPD